METTSTAQGLYRRLERLREPFLRRAREAVELTIPTLLRQDYHTRDTDFVTPWQGVGARGVNNLSSKLLTTLFPPNSPFFRLRVDEGKAGILLSDQKVKTEIESTLAAAERQIMFEVETSNVRVKVHEALKHLVACGNSLIYYPADGPMRVYHLDSYVVQRNASGDLDFLIVRELVSPLQLSPEFLSALEMAGQSDNPQDRDQQSEEPTLEAFTYVRKTDSGWTIHQEIKDLVVPGTEGTYKDTNFPWLPLRMHVVDEEDYGRGYVEDYLGSLRSVEGLTQAVVEGTAAASKLVFMVKPNGTTKKRDIEGAPNGAIINGNREDVTVLQSEKSVDLRVAKETMTEIKQELAFAFLLNTSVQRQAERVTAEEIRYMAQELEDALGGVYSVLTQELQLPLVRILMSRLESAGRLPKMGKDTVKPTIVTGLEALGRGHDLQRLQVAFDVITRTYGPEALSQYTNALDGMARIFTSAGVDPAGLLKDEQQVAQEQQIQQIQQGMLKLGPEAIKQMGNAAQAQAAPAA